MSKQEKLLKRLLSRPTDFEWSEAVTLLGHYGFVVLEGSGSRRKLRHAATGQLIIVHVPHPQKELRSYVVDNIIQTLKEGGYIT
jgi:predicted RNA binding protein YcfA (HicA-like mRNA interferase family)